MSTDKLKALLQKISRLRVVVVGDIILDHYIWGDASRISPEAPVPVVEVDRDSYVAGAAANVALNITSMGAKADLLGTIGRDDGGKMLKELLAKNRVSFHEMFVRNGTPTIVKTRVVVRNQQLCRLDREAAPREYAIDHATCFPILKQSVREADAVILSDYAKGVLSEDLISTVQKAAHEGKTLVAYDPKPKRKINTGGFDLMTPNRIEALELAGIELGSHDAYPHEEVCQRIWEKYGPKRLIVTLGADGMMLSEQGKVLKIIPTYAREVFDVSGAGDTSIAGLTLALAAGADMEEAAHFANTAAGVVVAKLGTATVTPAEILTYDSSHD